jgi:hypothetical protein
MQESVALNLWWQISGRKRPSSIQRRVIGVSQLQQQHCETNSNICFSSCRASGFLQLAQRCRQPFHIVVHLEAQTGASQRPSSSRSTARPAQALLIQHSSSLGMEMMHTLNTVQVITQAEPLSCLGHHQLANLTAFKFGVVVCGARCCTRSSCHWAAVVVDQLTMLARNMALQLRSQRSHLLLQLANGGLAITTSTRYWRRELIHSVAEG